VTEQSAYVLVPREPTEEMYEVAYPWFGSGLFQFKAMWSAIAAALKEPPR
jgi:hypothetical protein